MKCSVKYAVLLPLCAVLVFMLMGAVSPEWKLVSRVSGTVESQASDNTEWLYIHQARLLKDGARARTGNDSRAKIQMADQSVVTIGSNTVVEVARFHLKENARIVELKMGVGRIRASVAKFLRGETSFEVKTTKAVLAARGTEFYVDVQDNSVAQEGVQTGNDMLAAAPGQEVFVSVYSGSVQATAGSATHTFFPGQSGIITAQGRIIVNPTSLPSVFTSASGWGRDRDMREREGIRERAPGTMGAPAYVPPGSENIPGPPPPPGTSIINGPLGPAPAPVFINPAASTPATQNTSTQPSTGTINVHIK